MFDHPQVLAEDLVAMLDHPLVGQYRAADQLIDNSLCGYRFAGLPRILAIAREAKTKNARVPVAVVHETAVSALVDDGNNVGYVAVFTAHLRSS
jgi:L-2-hydroxycarboxylate dehydrogenase (NAD+)